MKTHNLALAIAAMATASANAAPPPPISAAQVDAVFARWNRADAPGCAIRIDEAGKPIVDRAYGSVDLEHVAPINPNTVFEAGSVSKQFTAAAIWLLIEDGKLRLDDDVRRYIPDLPSYGTPIRIANLLHHTSGLRDWGAVAELAGWPRGSATYEMADVRAIIIRQKGLNFTPGSEYSYSNSGYNLLAMIVEKVSGTSFPRFTAERLFTPLGMTSTGWRADFRRIVPGRAISYSPKGNGYEQTMPLEGSIGNGGLLTTIADLQRWNEAMLANRIGRNVATRMQERGVLTDGMRIAYASGLFVATRGDTPEISHNGATGGYRAWLGTWPARKLSAALLCSAAEANTAALVHSLVDPLLPVPATPARSVIVANASRWAGLYVDSHDQPLVVAAKEGGLHVRGIGALSQTGEGRFRTPSGDEISAPAPDTLVLTSQTGRTRYRRVAPAPAAIVLGAFAGRFASSEVGAAYRVVPQGGGLRLALESRPQVGYSARAIGRDLFLDDAQNAVIHFHRNAAGVVDGLAITIARAFAVPFAKVG